MKSVENLTPRHRRMRLCLATALLVTLTGSSAGALEPKEGSYLGQKEFFLPELYITSSQLPLDEVLPELPNRAAWENFLSARERAGQARLQVFVDPRSGAATNLLDAGALIPGNGVGNRVTLEELGNRLGRAGGKVDPLAVAGAVLDFVVEHRNLLAIDVNQLGNMRAVQVTPDLWQIRVPQSYKGIPVRYGHLVATLSHGNLILVGTETWGNVRGLSPQPRVTADEAFAAGFDYVGGQVLSDEILSKPSLEIVPVAPPEHQQGEAFDGTVGQGYRHRLVWTFVFRRPPDDETWEVMVDAHSGEVIAFQDINNYAAEQITGGVYPVTSTEICPTNGTCGTMQSGWPMPFADTGLASPNNFTNSGGVFNYTSGTVTTTLTGRYVDIVDSCGVVSNSSTTGSINLGGTNGQHDCITGGGSAGNTPAARTAFYEVNKLAEQARGWLPGNTWLQSRLTTNVNLNNTCNAFWNGSSINFYRSGGGCRNTGELAGVFDHEWGHGLDDFDAGGVLSNSSEAYADIAAIYRLQTSCVGHGFFQTLDDGCGMTVDGTGFNANEAQVGSPVCCTDCSGVRDADYAKHSPATPATALGFVCSSCSTGTGPCGRQVHCSAAPSRQAAWDFVARDLTAAPFNLDSQTAFIVGNKVFYQGSGNIGSWHACTCGSSSSGCGSTNAYMQWLAADDDNGNINDGTPHMTALFNAFNRHGIACSTPTPVNSGCSGGPTTAPTLSATTGDHQVSLSWNAVTGATRTWVFRTEGHAGCNFGKTLIAEVTGTSFTDTTVANGRPYSYNVVAAGASSACFTRVSNCATVTPSVPTTPDFSISCSPSSLTIQQGTNGTSTCTVTSTNGFASAVSLSCTGQPAGVSCSFAPNPVTPPANGSTSSTLTVSVTASQPTGTFSFNAQGVGGALTRTAGMTVNVTSSGGGGPQNAVFDATLRAPKCGTLGSSCDSGTLLDGRDGKGPEPNQPNTINGSCADGISGTYHSDESNDRIKVSTTDGSNFAPGKTVRIDATVWAWTTPSSDSLDLYFAANANSPTWVYITTLKPTVAGSQTLSATYTLPTGTLQAVRARFRYQGSAATCGTGSWDDHDDLIFTVDGGGGPAPGPETAVFDATLQAPKCGTVGISCDSGTSLLNGRDGKGPEPNQPNTISDSCADGISGTYHIDESNDRIKVSTTDGSAFAPGKTVRIDATVWAWSTGSSDRLDLYFAANANSPTWVYITTLAPPTGGAQTLSATYTLPAGTLQAVRANFRYLGSTSSCSTGSYDDHDDLIFAVNP